jgi:hypothetical protein
MESSKIIHVTSKKTAQGSRIASQRKATKNNDIVIVFGKTPIIKRGMLDPGVIKYFLANETSCFIFHQHTSLVTLSVCTAINKLRRKKHRIIYDAHDIMDAPINLSLVIHHLLEKYISFCNVDWITVSNYHSDYFRRRYGVTPEIYYNSPVGLNLRQQTEKPHTLDAVYFGAIDCDRLDPDRLSDLAATGLRISIHGRWIKSQNDDWGRKIIDVVRSSGGDLRPEYEPDNLEFLNNYTFLVIQYNPSPNINGALPNKIFQALAYGLYCIVPKHMEEIWKLFGDTGYIIEESEVLGVLSGKRVRDIKLLQQRLLAIESHNLSIFQAMGKT